MEFLPPPPTVAAGLFLGSFWLIVVLLLGVLAMAVIRSRFDP